MLLLLPLVVAEPPLEILPLVAVAVKPPLLPLELLPLLPLAVAERPHPDRLSLRLF